MSTRFINDFSNFVLADTKDVTRIDTSAANRAATLAMLSQAQHTVDILSRDFDGAIYDHADITSALRRFVLQHRRTRVRILVRDLGPAIARGHRLLGLAQRLSTYIQVKTYAREHRSYVSAHCAVDTTGTILRRFATRYEADVCFRNALQARDLTRTFDDMWAAANPDPNVRSLHI